VRDVGARAVHRVDPGFLQKIIIRGRDPATDDHRTFRLRRRDQRWDDKGFVARPLARDDDVDVVLDRLPRRLLRSSNRRPRGEATA
jgi:hypothetical protein